jgi:hypothetical protein
VAHRVADKVTLATVVELSFQGNEASTIAKELKLSLRLVHQLLERLEGAMLLLAHDFPCHLLAKVMRLTEEEARVYLDAIRKHLGKNEQVRDFQEAKKITPLTGEGTSLGAESREDQDIEELSPLTGEEAAQALEVLDFWASKWL